MSQNDKKNIHERYKNYIIGSQIKSKQIPDNLMKKGLAKLEIKRKYGVIKPKEKKFNGN